MLTRRGFLGALLAAPVAAVAAVRAQPFTRYLGVMDPSSENGLLAILDDGTYVSNYGGIDRSLYVQAGRRGGKSNMAWRIDGVTI